MTDSKHSESNGHSRQNKTDAGNGSKAICRVSNVHPSPSPDPSRSPKQPSAMTTLHRLLCLLLAAAASIFAGDAGQPPKATWPAKDYTKVVGYRFKIPSDDAKGPVPSGFSLLTKAGLDVKQLANLTIKSAELSPAQVAKLEKATFSITHRSEPAACYDPHHIFVFYGKDGTVTNAIEVCFSCTGLATIPAATEEQWYRHDFVALAYLADELGLWLENRTAKAYEELQKEREKP